MRVRTRSPQSACSLSALSLVVRHVPPAQLPSSSAHLSPHDHRLHFKASTYGARRRRRWRQARDATARHEADALLSATRALPRAESAPAYCNDFIYITHLWGEADCDIDRISLLGLAVLEGDVGVQRCSSISLVEATWARCSCSTVFVCGIWWICKSLASAATTTRACIPSCAIV